MTRVWFLVEAGLFILPSSLTLYWDPSWGWSNWGVKLTTHLHLVPRCRNCGFLSSWILHTSTAWLLRRLHLAYLLILTHWPYSLLRALASFTTDTHSSALFASCLHFSLSAHSLYLPAISVWVFKHFFYFDWLKEIFLATPVCSILVPCPNHYDLFLFMSDTQGFYIIPSVIYNTPDVDWGIKRKRLQLLGHWSEWIKQGWLRKFVLSVILGTGI
jgi:hypothetical protein